MNIATATPISASRPAPPRPSLAQSSDLRRARRKIANVLMWIFAVLATICAVVPLLLVLYYVVIKGLPVLNLQFFTQIQKPPGEPGGGMKHAIVGSLILIGLASCIGLPIGVLGGVYLAEFGNNRFGHVTRFCADVLNGVPSIVIGIIAYTVAVLPVAKATHGAVSFSALSGGLALGIMMIPTVMRTTEELVRLVPSTLREAALGLGSTRWRAVLQIVLGAAKGGVITGVLLAIARIAGETAPLLFTAFGSDFFNVDPRQPIASLPQKIYIFATSPDDHWNALAWGAALILILIVLILSIASRFFTRDRMGAK